MQIDWITVTAQIINFLILVWLLKHFLYQPVLRAMERREQHIANQLNEAEQREQQAREQMLHYQSKTEELERRDEEILSKARNDAEQLRKRLLEEAREETAMARANWQRQINEEKEEFLNNLRHQMIDTIQLLARKALSDLANSDLEERIVHVFINRLKSLDQDSRKALANVSEPLHISSAFELDAPVCSRLTRAIHEHLAEGIKVEYSRSPELLCGIELTSGGQRLSWNLADYLEEMATHIEAAFTPTETAKKEA